MTATAPALHAAARRPRARQLCLIGALVITAILAGCASRQDGRSGTGGGYAVGGGDYRKDGPHAKPPANLDKVPDAVPRIEPYASGANRPYVINGRQYVPDLSDRAYRTRGMASWYGAQFHGRPTSNGETYDMYAMTAAHPTLPIPSYARVTRADTGKSVIVRINDRGPFHSDRVIDLSYVAAHRLGTLAAGTGEVVVERITPDEIRRGKWQQAPAMIASAPEPVASAAPVSMAAASRNTSVWSDAGTQPASGFNVVADGPAPTEVAAANPLSVLAGIPVPEAPAAAPSQTLPPAPSPVVPAAATPAQAPSPAATARTPGPPATDGGAFLQLGAFGEAHNAQLLADRLRANVSQLGHLEVVNQGDDVYRVRLGPFADRNSAVAHVDAVWGQTGIRPHVVVQ
ncbi:septal ring lytic transglycosylase RlpA family protein [Verticiella sediminum]|uniref:Endolytic peptidoglycan transglycosylase RlpA n=1 Tax=Verticiella sediminum TaxID=1247510 RepID=A0A556A6G3_9BURK|nr:septal ring lytic transglycosylase RlpA family protein [Verticiella sediminum]TSH88462.1 septal ring lytic transglycosylase RlpA family protein [Verticiella sediminum]